MPASYKDFLALLLSLGTKLPALWPVFQAWLAATRTLIEEAKKLLPSSSAAPAAGTLADFGVTSEEAEMETVIGAHVAGPNAAFDGHILRAGWQFLQAHPELLTLLVSLLKGG